MIKMILNCDMEKPKTCDVCPFCQENVELEYGECAGYSTLWCGLTKDDIGFSYDEIGLLSTCPIISIETIKSP